MAQHRLYNITSIGRPLDPRYATNRAVQRLMPIAAVAAGFALALDPLAGIRLLELSPMLLSAVGILSALWVLNIALTRSVASWRFKHSPRPTRGRTRAC